MEIACSHLKIDPRECKAESKTGQPVMEQKKIRNCFCCLFFIVRSVALMFCNKNMSTVIFNMYCITSVFIVARVTTFWLRDGTDCSFCPIIFSNVVTMAMHRKFKSLFLWCEGKSFTHLFLLWNTLAVLTTIRMLPLCWYSSKPLRASRHWKNPEFSVLSRIVDVWIESL